MTQPMSPESEKDIRNLDHADSKIDLYEAKEELLAEIDRLRGLYQNQIKVGLDALKERNEYKAERDQLREKLEIAVRALEVLNQLNDGTLSCGHHYGHALHSTACDALSKIRGEK